MLSIEQHVLMIPLGGDSMINGSREDELRELKRITTNIVAVIDSERIKEKWRSAEQSRGVQGIVQVCWDQVSRY